MPHNNAQFSISGAARGTPMCRQHFAKRGSHLVDRVAGLGQYAWHREEWMNHAFVPREGNSHTGFCESLGVGFAFVAQHITFRGDYQGRRQPLQVWCEERRRVDVGAIGRLTEIELAEPLHQRTGQIVAVREFAMRSCVERLHVRHRIDQHLERERGSTIVAATPGNHCRESSSRAIAGHGDSARIDAKLCRVLSHPNRGGMAVIHGSREFVFGGEPVVDRNDDSPGPARQHPAHTVVALDVAEHPSATVKIHNAGTRAAALRRIDSNRDCAAGTRDVMVLDLRHLLRLAADSFQSFASELTRRRRIERFERRSSLGFHRRENGLHFRIESIVLNQAAPPESLYSRGFAALLSGALLSAAYFAVIGFTSPQSADSHFEVNDIFMSMGRSDPADFITIEPLACSASWRSMVRSPVIVLFPRVHSM